MDPAQQKRKRTKKSNVWHFFEEDEETPGKVRCTLCAPAVYELAYTSSTTNLTYHLKTKHAREFHQREVEETEDPAGPSADPDSRTRSNSLPTQQRITEFTPLTGERKRQLDRQCLLWLTSSMRPFKVVDDPALKEWVSMISSSRYIPPSRKTLTSMTPDLFLAVEDTVCITAPQY
jgi:hypothetical protein